jgi:hypothetical protein
MHLILPHFCLFLRSPNNFFLHRFALISSLFRMNLFRFKTKTLISFFAFCFFLNVASTFCFKTLFAICFDFFASKHFSTLCRLFCLAFKKHNRYNMIEFLNAVAGIVTRCCNGITNHQLFFLFKAITCYKCSGCTLVKTISVITKTILKRYKVTQLVER